MELMTRRDWPGDFKRTISTGERLEFPRGVPVEVNEADLEELLPDIGKALVCVRRDERGAIRIDEDAMAELLYKPEQDDFGPDDEFPELPE